MPFQQLGRSVLSSHTSFTVALSGCVESPGWTLGRAVWFSLVLLCTRRGVRQGQIIKCKLADTAQEKAFSSVEGKKMGSEREEGSERQESNFNTLEISLTFGHV